MSSSNRTRALEKRIAQYREDHWGQRGPYPGVRQLVAADPTKTLVEIGHLVRVVYRTKKGRDTELTDYDHAFSRELPVLAYEPGSSLLVILGGTYRVETRGIVG